MEKARIFLAATLLILVSATVGYGFDIAIYKDPLSWKNDDLLRHNRLGWWPEGISDSPELFAPVFDNHLMDSVYEWYQQMGVIKVMVNYIYPDNFNWIKNDSTDIQVMNWYFPGIRTMHGEKYFDAQYRDVPNRPTPLPASLTVNAFPNPFNSVTTLSLTLPPFAYDIDLAVYNVTGQMVSATRLAATSARMTYRYDSGNLSTGLYFLRVSSANFQTTTKLMVLK